MTAEGGDTTRVKDRPYLSVHTDVSQLGDDELAGWDELVSSTPGAVTQRRHWCAAWMRHYGKGRALRILVFRSGSAVVGVLPVFVEALGWPPAGLRVAKLVGSDSSSMAYGTLPIAPEHRVAVLADAVQHLLSTEGCDVVSFGPMRRDEQVVADATAAAPAGVAVQCVREPPGKSMWFDTSEGADDFRGRMSANRRQQLRRAARSLAAAGIETELVPDSELPVAIDDFIDMHQRQWVAVGQQGHFVDWRHSAAFHRDLVREAGPAGFIRLYRARTDTQTVAYEYVATCGEQSYGLLPARELGEQWDKTRVGNVLHAEMAAAEGRRGVRTVDLGRGDYEHKRSQGALEAELVRIRFVAPGRRAAWSTAAVARVTHFAHLAYYRLWFGEVRPRVRFLRPHALHRWWIRWRI